MIPVFVTRPRHQAAALTKAVAARGFDPVAAPCLVLAISKGAPLDLSDVGAFAVTSANGVAALAARTAERGLPLYAVGAATAAAAGDSGFTRIHTADGDGAALARLIARQPPAGSILHVSGDEIAFDLVAALAAEGIDARRQILYAMEPAARLPDAALSALRGASQSFALLMSARTAQVFGDLVEAAEPDACRRIAALCLSAAISEVAAARPYRRIAVASAPAQHALLDLLEAESRRV